MAGPLLNRRCVIAATALLPGCAGKLTHELITATGVERAHVPDMGRVRIWGDAGRAEVARYLAGEASILRRRAATRATSNILSISGGADDGAFSAGLIFGWGQRGDRPLFDAVTGISAGALVAPFAFLGRGSDAALATVFTTHGPDDIYRATPIAGLLGGPALADTAPLAALIERYVDRAMLRAIAVERARGRYLFIGTTHLAAERPVFWDIGRIAAYDTPQSAALVRNVLRASASVPGLFEPVQITVQVDGKPFTELHVDGGPTREVFLSPSGLTFDEIDRLTGMRPTRRLWVIRNGKLAPEFQSVPLKATDIAVRALATLTKNQGIGDLNRIYQRARRDSIDFNLASIPQAFSAPRPRPFDRDYMRALYAQGIAFGQAGAPWSKVPPDASPRG